MEDKPDEEEDDGERRMLANNDQKKAFNAVKSLFGLIQKHGVISEY